MSDTETQGIWVVRTKLTHPKASDNLIGRDEFKAQAERDWAQTDDLAFNFNGHRISAAESVAWVATKGMGKGRAGGQEFEFPLRMTAVFEQQGDKWYMVQSHVSLPAQAEGDSVPV